VDPEQLQKERAERLREALELSPHEMGGTATKLGDSDEVQTEASKKFVMIYQNKLLSLVEDINSGEQGLGRFWREFMVFPVPYFCLDITLNCFMEELDIPALEIVVQVFEQRKDEFVAHLPKMSSTVFVTRFEDFFEQQCLSYCTRLGEKYEEVKNYRGSILWYERALAHGIKLPPRVAWSSSTIHSNLGFSQRHAGLLSAVLESYNASLQLDPGNVATLENRKELLDEMEAWTGSSGKLTPGC
jgi:hypothetical protein